jgi:P2-related tail formation protein
MAQLTIQPSINDLRSQSLLKLIERLDGIDLSQILVYRLDSAPDSALLLLAWQFDMLAPQWQLGANVAESIDSLTNIDALTNIDTLSSSGGVSGPSDYDSLRALLKAAIPLHRTRGTPSSIKAALAALGWKSATLYEGQASWGGNTYPPSEGWAAFRVQINLGASQTVSAEDPARIASAINFFKPVRAWLDSLWFQTAPIGDAAPAPSDFVRSIFSQVDSVSRPFDAVAAPAWIVADIKSTTPLYDAHFIHSGLSYGANEPAVADSGVVVNGEAISAEE